MSKEGEGTPVIVPREVVEEVDEVVGSGERSRFFADAAKEKLTRIRLLKVATDAAGCLATIEIPGWESSDAAAGWVRALRRADDVRTFGQSGVC